MNKERICFYVKTALFASAAVTLGVLITVDSKGAAATAAECIKVCTDTLIPSLFAYMVLATFVVKSGLGYYIFLPLWYVLRKIIRVDRSLFTVFMLSQVGGYPVGIKLLNELIAQNKNYYAIKDKAVLFCFGSGPAFVTGIIGQELYKSTTAGLIIFFSCLAADFIMAAFICRNFPKEKSETVKTDFSAAAVAKSVSSSAGSMLVICTSVIIFNIMSELFTSLFSVKLSPAAAALWEVTNIKYAGASLALPVAAALISFGGLCVIFQVISISTFKIHIGKFIIFRVASAGLSALICYFVQMLVGYRQAAEVSESYAISVLSPNPVVLICIAVMTGFVLSAMTSEKVLKKY